MNKSSQKNQYTMHNLCSKVGLYLLATCYAVIVCKRTHWSTWNNKVW